MGVLDRQGTIARAIPQAPVCPGLLVVHGNRTEQLLQLALQWMRRTPLPPLASEVWLVPSQAVAQWIRQTLAAGPDGIAAGLELLLPAQWLWQTYRALLGAETVPDVAPLDKAPLTWRLWRLLPTLKDDLFAPLIRYLSDDEGGRKRGQLAHRLADLYDHYQVYRSDWLSDWAAGRDQIRDSHGVARPLPARERWQAALWRVIRADLDDTDEPLSRAGRADIHAAFVAAAHAHRGPRPAGLPPRLTVFGLSALPPATLEALALAARWTQVLVFVLNPCREYWADIVPDNRWLDQIDAHWRRPPSALSPDRQVPLDALAPSEHHPLLAAWGRQAREYVALLQAWEEQPVRNAQDNAQQPPSSVEFFDDPVPPGSSGTLLTQLQDDILHDRSLAQTRARWPAVDPARDLSLRFHVCHTALREVEVLHDQLLAAMHADATLQPRDILVMVPDVAVYAPLFHAVFGRIAPSDARYIPYTVSDVADEAEMQVLEVVRALLALPKQRVSASEVLQWLELPAFARRFAIAPTDLQQLRLWVADAGIRWGLDDHHQRSLGLVAAGNDNALRLSWRDGLHRLWLGYALGPADADWLGLVPARSVTTLDANLIERLQALVDTLTRLSAQLATPATAAVWVERLQTLLAQCFDDQDPSVDAAQTRALQRLRSTLLQWGSEASAARDEPLPLAVVADAWLARAAPPAPGQRFCAGALTIATLMPMRAVPFRIICLLGLHDGAYPRQQNPNDFDLIARYPRPGDRVHRSEDHYLLLEALLSARERMIVSWVGRSAIDDSERAASTLVAQLRAHIAAGWRLAGHDDDEAGAALLDALTLHHRLHPFDATYFPPSDTPSSPPEPTQRWFSYAHEWIPSKRWQSTTPTLGAWTPDEPIDTAALTQFLRNPAQAFYQQRLRIGLPKTDAQALKREPLAPDALERWRLNTEWVAAVVRSARAGQSLEQALSAAQDVWQRAVARIRWPPGAFGSALARDWREAADRVWRLANAFFRTYSEPLPQPDILDEQLPHAGCTLRIADVLGPLYRSATGMRARLIWQGSAVVSPRDAKSGGQYRLPALLPAWVQHVAHHRAGGPVCSWVISACGEVMLSPLTPQQGAQAWQALLAYWCAGMSSPLPFEPRCAAAWLYRLHTQEEAASAWDAARLVYDGDDHQAGVRDLDPYWRRAFADFTALAGARASAAHSAFAQATHDLLRPLQQSLARPPSDVAGECP